MPFDLNTSRHRTGPEATGSTDRPGLPWNVSWNVAGNVVNAVCQWGVIALMAKLGNPAMIGQYALGLAISLPVVMLTNMQLSTVEAVDLRSEFSDAEYLQVRLISASLTFCVIVGIASVAGYTRETALMIVAVGAGKCLDAVSDIFYGLFQRNERMDVTSRSLMAKGTLGLVAVAGSVALAGSALLGIVAWTCAKGMVLLLYDAPKGRRISVGLKALPRSLSKSGNRWSGLRWTKVRTIALVVVAFPLGLTMMLNSLEANIPRYFIDGHCGETSLGIFSSIAYFLQAGEVVARAMGEASMPRLTTYWLAGDFHGFRWLLGKLVAVGLAMGAAGVLVALLKGPELVARLYKPEYAENASLITWVMIAGVAIYPASFLSFGLFATRSFTILPWVFSVVALISLAGSALLIPRYGLVGAAWVLGVVGIGRCAAAVLILSLKRWGNGSARDRVTLSTALTGLGVVEKEGQCH